MITEYIDEFKREHDYGYIPPGLVRDFDEYLEVNDVPLDEAYYSITDFGDTLNVISKTKRNYQTRLRRFVEFVYDKEDIPIIEEESVLEWE